VNLRILLYEGIYSNELTEQVTPTVNSMFFRLYTVESRNYL
jgi:hypothetical protein